METIHTIYPGELRPQATHIKSGYQLITDVPKEHGGRGESFSPTDLFCAFIVCSMLSNMASVERDAEFNGTIAGIKIRTTKVLQQSPTMVTEISIEFNMPKNNFSDEQKKKLESAANNSQVGRSLSPDLKLSVNFNY